MSAPLKIPPPGLDGTYRDSCVVCMQGTDTGLGFTGCSEYIVAGLMALGIPQDQATGTLTDATGCDPGKVPAGEYTIYVRVCRPCAAAAGRAGGPSKVGLFVEGGELPGYYDPTGAKP